MSKKPKPDNMKVAQMKYLSDMGSSHKAIARTLGCSNHTVKKYLSDDVLQDDPVIKEIVATIKKKELEDLNLIIGKARKRLHEILDEGKTKAIETTAIMDRCFQQRRLLEGESTSNLSILDVAKAINAGIERIEREAQSLGMTLEEVLEYEPSEDADGENGETA